MDLNSVMAVERPRSRDSLGHVADGDAFLAGGTWLFSEPQPRVTRLIDLSGFDWEPLTIGDSGLTISATCPVAVLEAFEPPAAWRAGPLIRQCCHAFLASFKIWSMATVGGNLCIALPAGPMISLCAALDGSCLIWRSDGGQRHMPVADLVLGPQRTALAPGELLRQIDIPIEALGRRTAFRRISLTPLGRSAALLIGTRAGDNGFNLVVTAATPRPLSLHFERMPDAAVLRARLDGAIPPGLYFDDVHGTPEWRRHMTYEFAEEIRAELA